MSETAATRELLAPYCQEPWGVDMGFGGDPIVSHAITFDLPGGSYGAVGNARQILKGDCRDLSMFCDGALDWIYSAHLLEDFTYLELVETIIPEWRRVLRWGGSIVTNCPNQQKFLNHCYKTGQGINYAHKEQDFSLETFERNVIANIGPWECVMRLPEHGAYSWCLVVRKIAQAPE